MKNDDQPFFSVCVSLLIFRQSHLLDFTSTTPTQQNCVLVYSASSAARISNQFFFNQHHHGTWDLLCESRGFCSGSVVVMHHSLSRVFRPWAPSHPYEVWHIWRCEINRGATSIGDVHRVNKKVMSTRCDITPRILAYYNFLLI